MEDHDIARLQEMVDDIRRIRDRRCDPKSNENPRYHALSLAVSSLTKAIASLEEDLSGQR